MRSSECIPRSKTLGSKYVRCLDILGDVYSMRVNYITPRLSMRGYYRMHLTFDEDGLVGIHPRHINELHPCAT